MRRSIAFGALALAVAMSATACAGNAGPRPSSAPSGAALPAGVTITAPERLAEGLDLFRGHADRAFGLAEPRPQDLTAVRIDLQTPGLRFTTGPAGGTDDPPRPGHQVNTEGRSVGDAIRRDPSLVLAVNANFFWPCCEPSGSAPTGMTLFGLAVDNGAVVSDPRTMQQKAGPGCGAEPAVPGPDDTGAAALVIDRANRARIVMQTAKDELPADVQAAVAGGPQPVAGPTGGCGAGDDYPPLRHVVGPTFLLQSGHTDTVPAKDPPEIIAARTFAGTSADGRFLYLATIDGGEQSGAAFHDEAQWLLLLGASTGLNLDGGGSTTMALNTERADRRPAAACPPTGSVQLLNVPYGYVDGGREVRCGERLVGNHLGVAVERR